MTTTQITGATALFTSHDIARNYPRMIAKGGSAIEEQLILTIMLTILCVYADTLLYCGKTLLQLGTCEAPMQSRALVPFCEHVVRCTERGHPIDCRTTT